MVFLTLYSHTTDEIHFNLMALVADKKKLYERQMEDFGEKRDAAAQRVSPPFPSALSVRACSCTVDPEFAGGQRAHGRGGLQQHQP